MGKVDFKISMSNKKSNHNHKWELECVSGLLLNCYHKTFKLVQECDTQHAFLWKIIKWASYIKVIKYDTKQGYNSKWHAYSWSFENGVVGGVPSRQLSALIENNG